MEGVINSIFTVCAKHATLNSPVQRGDQLTLVFPRTGRDYTGQKGTLDDIAANYDYATAQVEVQYADNTFVSASDAKFKNLQAIVRFNLQDKSSKAISVSSLTISADGLLQKEGVTGPVTITPATATNDIYAAPSGINLQPWRFVVVTDASTKAKLAGPRNSMITQAPVVIVVCGETTWTHKPWGEPDAPEVTESNRNWTADCAAATENLLLAAEATGLGAVWTACYPYEERMATAIEALGIPENVLPYCIIPVGYPGGDEQPKDKWKPENIHYEKW